MKIEGSCAASELHNRLLFLLREGPTKVGEIYFDSDDNNDSMECFSLVELAAAIFGYSLRVWL